MGKCWKPRENGNWNLVEKKWLCLIKDRIEKRTRDLKYQVLIRLLPCKVDTSTCVAYTTRREDFRVKFPTGLVNSCALVWVCTGIRKAFFLLFLSCFAF